MKGDHWLMYLPHQLTNRNTPADAVNQTQPYTSPVRPPTACADLAEEGFLGCRLGHERGLTHMVLWFCGVLREKQPPTSKLIFC